jgi:hypothetical protein
MCGRSLDENGIEQIHHNIYYSICKYVSVEGLEQHVDVIFTDNKYYVRLAANGGSMNEFYNNRQLHLSRTRLR